MVSRRLGLALTGLRVALLALVIGMLLQPVRPWTLDKTIQRYVAVLVDNSASMYVPDTQLVPSEKIRLAQRFSSDPLPRLHGFDSAADDLDALRSDLAPHSEWLASLGGAQPSERLKALQVRREALNKAFLAAEKKADDLVDGPLQAHRPETRRPTPASGPPPTSCPSGWPPTSATA